MRTLPHLLARNRAWSARMVESDPTFFQKLSQQQTPKYLWIGCADSRVPATEIVDLLPGEMFVHRNVANVVVHTDLNCLAVLQFAVEALKVEDIIVCGHYSCGGVRAALDNSRLGLIDNWLRNVRDVLKKHEAYLMSIDDEQTRFDRLCELNVIEQVSRVCETTVVQEAWRRGQPLAIHGWIYGLSDGLLKDLSMCVTGGQEQSQIYQGALERLKC